jgi:hypothetical protein
MEKSTVKFNHQKEDSGSLENGKIQTWITLGTMAGMNIYFSNIIKL